MIFPSLQNTIIVLAILLLVMALCIMAKKLTPAGSVMAVLIGWLVFMAGGYISLIQLFSCFILAVLATRHRKDLKVKSGPHSETRDVWQVLSNGGATAIVAIVAIFDRSHILLYTLMMAGSLAAATADTVSSELGVIYGSRSFNILTFKKEPKGLDGVISIEGTLLGVLSAFIIAAIYMWDISLLIITLAGVLGNFVDSVLGATLERRMVIGNNMVNFLNTTFGAVIAMVLYWSF